MGKQLVWVGPSQHGYQFQANGGSDYILSYFRAATEAADFMQTVSVNIADNYTAVVLEVPMSIGSGDLAERIHQDPRHVPHNLARWIRHSDTPFYDKPLILLPTDEQSSRLYNTLCGRNEYVAQVRHSMPDTDYSQLHDVLKRLERYNYLASK